MKKLGGFAVAEKVVAIVVMGLILGVGLYAYNNIFKKDQTRQTIEKVEGLKKALEEYFIKNNRLPCPSPASNVSNFTEDCSAAPISRSASYNGASLTMLYGKVPTQTIGVSNDMAVDEFGNFISYTVVAPLTTAVRFYRNPNNTTFTLNELSQAQPFVDSIIADYGSIGEQSTNVSSAITQFIKVMDVKNSGFPAVSTQNLINYANGLVTPLTTDGRLLAVDAIFVLVSHGFNGYCGYNAQSGQMKGITLQMLSDPRFYFNDYINCVNIHSPNSSSLTSRAFVFNSLSNSLSSEAKNVLTPEVNDIVAFSRYSTFFDKLQEMGKVDCPATIMTSAQPTNPSFYSFARAAASNNTPVMPFLVSVNGTTAPSSNYCSIMVETKFQTTNPSALCQKSGRWTNFVPLTCGMFTAVEQQIY